MGQHKLPKDKKSDGDYGQPVGSRFIHYVVMVPPSQRREKREKPKRGVGLTLDHVQHIVHEEERTVTVPVLDKKRRPIVGKDGKTLTNTIKIKVKRHKVIRHYKVG